MALTLGRGDLPHEERKHSIRPRLCVTRIYELERLPKTAEIVRLNRKGGPERVIDEVETSLRRASSLSTAWQLAECGAIIKGYAGKAGFTPSQVNK